MTINIIATIDNNGCLGNKKEPGWFSFETWNFLLEKTKHKTIIMGKKTWDTYPFKPFPNRENIIITHSPYETGDKISSLFDLQAKNCGTEDNPVISMNNLIITGNLEDAIRHSKNEIFFIGGEEIFIQSLKYADTIYLLKSNKECFNGNLFFPYINNDWIEYINDENIDMKIFKKFQKDQD